MTGKFNLWLECRIWVRIWVSFMKFKTEKDRRDGLKAASTLRLPSKILMYFEKRAQNMVGVHFS